MRNFDGSEDSREGKEGMDRNFLRKVASGSPGPGALRLLGVKSWENSTRMNNNDI